MLCDYMVDGIFLSMAAYSTEKEVEETINFLENLCIYYKYESQCLEYFILKPPSDILTDELFFLTLSVKILILYSCQILRPYSY